MNPQDVGPGNPQQQVIERLKTAVNVLVTVSNSPSVDQLAAAVGFTLMLNKMGKHATAVFSGDIPSTIEFLKPEATIEKNTDSLRDFIVSLDKSKADKLRYKVEDNVVKIFITPYRTSLTEKDLDFSQGDFNVDAVVALGVAEREQLDQAIVAHGRILHDATVITISAGEVVSSLGAINWQDAVASSLCEMLVSVGELLQTGLLDNQIATAYLTGIVAQTERFRNNRTTPKIMTMSAQLMAAGANQQLIADSLEAVLEVQAPKAVTPALETPAPTPADSPDGALTIEHETSVPKADPAKESAPNLEMPVQPEEKSEEVTAQISINDQGVLSMAESEKINDPSARRRLIDPHPSQGNEQAQSGTFAGGPHPFTANMDSDGENEQSSDPLTTSSAPQTGQTLDHNRLGTTLQPINANSGEPGGSLPPIPVSPIPLPDSQEIPSVSESTLPPLVQTPLPDNSNSGPLADTVQTLPPAFDDNTLRDIEKTFDSTHIVKDPTSTLNEIEEVEHSPHLAQQSETVDSARDAVNSAINATPYDPSRPQPLQALNATQFDISAPTPPVTSADPILAGLGLTDQPDNTTPLATADSSVLPTLPPSPLGSQLPNDDSNSQAPPPVPPPLMPLQ